MLQRIFWGTAGASIVVALTGLASGVLLARLLGPDDRGLLTAITLWAPIIAAFFIAGVHESGSYYIAHSHNNFKMEKIIVAVFWLSVILSFIGFLIAFFILFYFSSDGVNKKTFYLSLLYLLYIPIYILSTAMLGVDQGNHKFRAYNIVRMLQPLIYLVGLSAFYFLGEKGLAPIVLLLLFANSISFFSRLYSYRWVFFRKPLSLYIKILFNKGLMYHSAFLVFMVSSQLDRIILVSVVDNHAIGIYIVAYTLMYSATNLVGSTFQTIIFPLAAKLKSHQDKVAFITGMFQVSFLFLFFSILFLFFTTYFFVLLFFGEKYFSSILIAKILSVGYGLVAAKNIVVRSIRALGDTRIGFNTEVVYILNFLLSILFFYLLSTVNSISVSFSIVWAASISYFYVLYGFCNVYGVKWYDFFSADSGVKAFKSLFAFRL